jgi:hypothetical protein
MAVRIILASALYISTPIGSGDAEILTFDDIATPPLEGLTSVPKDYGGVSWSPVGCPVTREKAPCGPAYEDVYWGWGVMNPSEYGPYSGINPPKGYANGLVSGRNVVYGDSAEVVNGIPFDTTIQSLSPNGFSLASGDFATFENLTSVSKTVVIGTTGPTKITFDWTNVASVYFTLSGGIYSPYGSGVFAMDNLDLSGVPETTTWVMMLLGFAGLGYAGYRQTRKGDAAAPA